MADYFSNLLAALNDPLAALLLQQAPSQPIPDSLMQGAVNYVAPLPPPSPTPVGQFPAQNLGYSPDLRSPEMLALNYALNQGVGPDVQQQLIAAASEPGRQATQRYVADVYSGAKTEAAQSYADARTEAANITASAQQRVQEIKNAGYQAAVAAKNHMQMEIEQLRAQTKKELTATEQSSIAKRAVANAVADFRRTKITNVDGSQTFPSEEEAAAYEKSIQPIFDSAAVAPPPAAPVVDQDVIDAANTVRTLIASGKTTPDKVLTSKGYLAMSPEQRQQFLLLLGMKP